MARFPFYRKTARSTSVSVEQDVPNTEIELPTSDLSAQSATNHMIDTGKNEAFVSVDKADQELPDENLQGGVKRVEAITLSWTKKSLIIVYINLWMLYFVNAFQMSLGSNLDAYVVSSFQQHSLIPVIAIVSNVMSGAAYLPVAKALDLCGRAEGFSFMAGVATIGIILMAGTKNIATYCAAQVFYYVGFSGMIYSVDVITSDTSTLRNRGLAFAFTSTPYIITAFAGPTAAEDFYEKISWRWAFGTFAVILPFVAAPLFATLYTQERKAIRKGLLTKEKSGRRLTESVRHYVVEFDAAGIFLLAAGLILFLLPFSIAGSEEGAWRSASVISMLVIGVVLLAVFAVNERWLAPKPFIPFHLLTSRTVVGACMLEATYQVAYYCWNSYFSSYLQVVYNLTIAQAGYVSSTFDIVSGVWLLLVGFMISKTGRFKWLLMCAVPLYILGVGLMIYFRHPGTNIGYIVMTQIFIAFAGGTIIDCQQVAVMSAGQHGDVAALLALLGLFGYMGGAVGNSISGAIWTNTMPGALQTLLPESVVADWETIYDDLTVQLGYPMGDPVREGIMQAYAVAQKRMLIAGTAIMVLALFAVAMIKNINVAQTRQVKGNVF